MSAQLSAVPILAAPEDFEVSSRRPSEHLVRLSVSTSRSMLKPRGFKAKIGLENVGRRALGIFLLLVTVFLWTASNFLASVSSELSCSGRTDSLTSAFSTYSQTTRTQNRTSSPTLTPPFSPSRSFPSSLEYCANMEYLTSANHL